jgi:hypothetical protein
MKRRGEGRDFGNHIALQVRRARVEQSSGDVWLREAFAELCRRLSPAWGSAHQSAEYWAKVMQTEPSIRAVGRDFARYLPGLFWLNFFGPRYCELLGAERLLTTPAHSVAAVGDGVLVALADDPGSWTTDAYANAERAARAHLGARHFFSKG